MYTYRSLRKAGYTGKLFIVVDDEDKRADEYRKRFGKKVLQFSKVAVAARIDEGDNTDDRRTVLYARNACWDLARRVGCRYFIQLDDDYVAFFLRYGRDLGYGAADITRMDTVLTALLKFYQDTPIASVAFSQGGDHIGGAGVVVDGKVIGGHPYPELLRKSMNSFILSTDRPFQFSGRLNEDVNTYTVLGRQGKVFFTAMGAMLVQRQTQSTPGGMTEIYLDRGTYQKSFFAIMYAPSCVKIDVLGDSSSPHYRIHHEISWENCVPKILRETEKKRRT